MARLEADGEITLIGRKELRAEKKPVEEIQQTSFEVDAQTKILSFRGETWQKIYKFTL